MVTPFGLVTVGRLMFTAVACAVCGWPLWLGIYAYDAFSPSGFLEYAASTALGIVLFVAQMVMAYYFAQALNWIWEIDDDGGGGGDFM